MRVQIAISGTKDETSSELKRVLANALLPVTCHAGATSRLGIIATKQM